MNVWIYSESDFNVGGGGADIKIFSSADKAMKAIPGNWVLQEDGSYTLNDGSYYTPTCIYEYEVDSEI